MITRHKKEDWYEENASHGAFALTQEEIDFYYRRSNRGNAYPG